MGEKSNARSEASYEALFENSADGILLTSPDGTILRANPAACHIFGYTEPELLALGRSGLVDHTDPRLEVAIEERSRTGKFHGEMYCLRKDGSRIPIELTTSVYVAEDGAERSSMVMRDVSERERAEKEREALTREISSQKRQLEEAFAQAPSFLAVLRGPEYVFEMANPAYYRLVGHRDLIGRAVLDALPELREQRFPEILTRVLETGDPFHARDEPILIRPGPGEEPQERFVTFVYQPMLGSDGVPSGILVQGIDTTEQVAARRSAEASEADARRHLAWLETVLDLLPVGVSITNSSGEVTLGNPAWHENWSPESAPGDLRALEQRRARWVETGELIAPTDWPLFRALRDGEATIGKEMEIMPRQGERKAILVSAVPIVDGDGRVEGAVVVAVDITQRREAESKLARSELRLRETQAAAKLGHWERDLETGRITLSSELRRILGLEDEAIDLQQMLDLVEPTEGAQGLFGDRAMEEGGTVAGEVRVRDATGSTHILWVRGQLIRNSGGLPISVQGIAQDMTDQRQMEQQLQQAQRMESIGRLAGGVAHDFNNLLTVIGGSAAFARSAVPEGSSAAGDLDEIERAVDRAADLTRQLLAFSRRQVLQPKVVDINEELERTAKMLRRLIGEDIELVVHAKAHGRVKVDPGQLNQVVMNLCINARDAMPEGGRILVETSDTTLTAEDVRALPYPIEAGPYVLLCVQDDGIGMDEEILPRIFEPFFTTKAKSEGTGLGLATVYGIVQQSGGYIHVESQSGRGTRVMTYFPRSDDGVAPRPRSGPAAAGGEGEQILLAEDEPALRKLTRRILEKSGYRVLEAANGEEALRLVSGRTAELDLIVSDVVMPLMGGRDLVKAISKERPGIPVLYMSGYIEDAALEREIEMESISLLKKPFVPEGLLAMVREALDRAPNRAT